MAKENQLIIQLRGFDAKHYTRTERYAKQVAKLYQTAADEFASLTGKINLPDGGTFNFDDFPKAKKQARGIVTRLAGKIEAVVTSGQRSEWLAACQKNDAFLAAILRTSKLTKEEAERYQARNLEALSAFQKRKENGLNLSQRVWKYAEELKDAMELGIDVGLGEGKSAQQLSRDLRQYLNEPDRLYRRVRDKGGNLRLSKAAKMYHPGQGVYRSSAKNAQRLTRTEINMAYRESEYLRWQQLDFIVGIRVMLSNNHTIKNSKGEPVPFVDICDTLAGDYPKTFKFVGWHPQCRCFAVPIMADYDEYNKNRANRLKAIVKGAQYKSLPSRRTVKDVPKAFRDYISSIEERAKGWKSMPYYIRDNFNGGKISGGLKTGIASKAMNTVEPCTDFDSDIAYYKRWAYSFGLDVSSLDTLRNSGNRAALTGEIDKVDNVLLQRKREWLRAISDLRDFIDKDMKGFADLQKEYTNIINANEVHTSNYYGDCITKLQQALSKAKTDLQKAKAEVAKTELNEVISRIESANVVYREVKDLPKTLTETEIIQRVGGGDLTKGSCSSLSFAYAGNKCGFDVLDFRDGQSRFIFSERATIQSITEKVGGIVQREYNDFVNAKGLLQNVVEGKEYIFCVGAHAAIVRKTKAGFEYLELQSPSNNGFKPLTTDELKKRFGCKRSHTVTGIKCKVSGFLIDIEQLKRDGGFKKLLGYINTKEDEQRKGTAGRKK